MSDVPLVNLNLFITAKDVRLELFDLLFQGHDQESLLLVPLSCLSDRSQASIAAESGRAGSSAEDAALALAFSLSLGNELTLLKEVFNSALFALHFFLKHLIFGFKFNVLFPLTVSHLFHPNQFFIELLLFPLVTGLVLLVDLQMAGSGARPSRDTGGVRLRLRVSAQDTC